MVCHAGKKLYEIFAGASDAMILPLLPHPQFNLPQSFPNKMSPAPLGCLGGVMRSDSISPGKNLVVRCLIN